MKKTTTLIIALILFTSVVKAQPEVFFAGFESWIEGLVIHNNKLYYSARETGKIMVVDMDDPTIAETLVEGLDMPFEIQREDNTLYITDPLNRNFYSVDLSADIPELELVATNLPPFREFVVKNRTVYIASNYNIYKFLIPLISDNTNVNVEEIFTGLQEIPNSLLLNGNELYIALLEYGSNNLVKLDISVENPELINVANAEGYPYDLSVENNTLYITSYGNIPIYNRILKIDLNEPEPYPELFVHTVQWNYESTISDGYLYWVEGAAIKRANFSKLSTNEVEIESFNIYPNPTSDAINISGLRLEQEYKIYNMLGVEISNGKVIDKDQINVSNFSSGTYVLQLENGSAFRFIKH